MDVEVQISGDTAFMNKLKAMTTMIDFTEGLRKAGQNLVNYFSGEVFKSMGGDFGTPWLALSPSTQAFKAKHYYEYQAVPLVATTTMQHSFVHDEGPLNMTVKNTTDYFKYHQSTAPRHKLPRRPMFAINTTVKNIIKYSIEEALAEGIAAL